MTSLIDLNNYKLSNICDNVFYIPNYVSEEQEKYIIDKVNEAPKPKWTQLRNRRLQNWGGVPHVKGLIPENIPNWLNGFLKQISNLGVFPGSNQPNHILVNEYLPGQGIMVKHLLKYEYTIFDNLRKSIFKEWNNVVEHWPILIKFDPYEECTGFILACKYLIKHSSKIKEIPAFTLYDAFGLDIQTIKELSKTLGLPINWNEFNCQLNALRSKTKNQVYHLSKNNDLINNFPATKDHFKYDIFRHADHSYIIPTITSKLIAILDTNGNVINDSNIHKYGKNVSLVLEKTNFYCESGGQESDIGIIRTKNGTNFVVKNVNKVQENGVILHHIESDKWPILLNEKELYVVIDVDHRLGLMRSHSSVHILNSILTSYLVVTCQTSSRVKKDLMLFKFALFGQKFTEKDALIIEKKVIDVIKSSMAIKRTTIMSNDLNKLNVTVIPGEVYPDGEVYVIDIFKDQSYLSREACCGTHVENTLDLIDFCLVQCKITNNECTLLGVTGYLCLNVQSYGIALLNKIIEIEKKINIMLKSEEIASNELKIVMDEINNLKFKTKGDSKTYMPLKNQIDANKKFFSIERKIQKIMKNEKKKILKKNLEKLYNEKYIVGKIDCDNFYFDDNRFHLDEVAEQYNRIPCLLFTFKNGIIHIYCQIPLEYSENEIWLKNLWKNLNITSVKFKIKGLIKFTDVKVKDIDALKCLNIIDNTIHSVKNHYDYNYNINRFK